MIIISKYYAIIIEQIKIQKNQMKNTIFLFDSAALLFITLCLTPIFTNAQSGTLDPSFGIDGKVITDFEHDDEQATSMLIQPDGKIIAAGYSVYASNANFALVRYNIDGTVDSTFDFDGIVTTDFEGYNDLGCGVAIQDDGKIIVAGYSLNGFYNEVFALARYNTNGSLDNSFDSDGKLITTIGTHDSYGLSIAIRSYGKIVVAGFSDNGNDDDFALARYNGDGSLDISFGTGGIVISDLTGNDDEGWSIAIQPDGKILVAGFSQNDFDDDFALARFNESGSLDNTFGTGGKVILDLGGEEDEGWSVALQPDGKILVAGDTYIEGFESDFALIRFNSDGSLDNTFGSGGIVTTDFDGSYDSGHSIAIQSDGKIIVGGSGYYFALARYNTDGSLDNTFGSGGKVNMDFGVFQECHGFSVALQSDGKILLAGYNEDGDYDFALTRYNNDVVSITENHAEENVISISPNPFFNELTITFNKNQTLSNGFGEVIIFDVLGKEIVRQKIFSGENKINTDNLLSGFYLLNYTEENKPENYKIVKN